VVDGARLRRALAGRLSWTPEPHGFSQGGVEEGGAEIRFAEVV